MPSLKRPVMAGNWKMNLGPTAGVEFVKTFLSLHPAQDDRTVLLFPPALTLASVRTALAGRGDVRVGVQNIHAEEKGAFTGENSAAIAKDAGADYVLVGHSERRHVFGETDAEVARKCAKAIEHGLVPVLCVGEKIEQREHGETEQVVLHQLRAGFSAMSHEQILGAIVAYEPVWAIGTGRTATPEDAAAVHRVIRAALADMVGAGATEIPILYGGSVTPANAAALLAADQVDGVLVGGASLDPAGWATICGTRP